MTNKILIWNTDAILLEKDKSEYLVTLINSDSTYHSFIHSSITLIDIFKKGVKRSDLTEVLVSRFSSQYSREDIQHALDLFLDLLKNHHYILEQISPFRSITTDNIERCFSEAHEFHLGWTMFTSDPTLIDIHACGTVGAYCDSFTPCCSGHACLALNDPPINPGTCRSFGGAIS